MGKCYLNGNGVEQNFAEAGICFHRAAGAGVRNAYETLGRFMSVIVPDSHDDKEAFDWYKLAADSGSSYAIWRLGYFYYLGRVVEQDYDRAIEYFSKVCHVSRTALLNMGDCYRDMKVYDRALDCYREAYRRGYVRSACRMALMYEEGLGVPVDKDEAKRLLLPLSRPVILMRSTWWVYAISTAVWERPMLCWLWNISRLLPARASQCVA